MKVPLKYLFLILAFFGNVSLIISQESLFSYEEYKDSDGAVLLYRKLVSDYDSQSKYPLVIFLHGSGERGNDNQSQLKWGVLNFASETIMKSYKPIVIAPQCPENMSWGNYSGENLTLVNTPTKPTEMLINLIEELIQTQPIDPDRVYITGLSMGGFGTFDIMARRPDLFAAAVPVCGGGDVTSVDAFSDIPLWVFHGAIDTTVPLSFSENMVQALQEKGASPGFTVYPDTGHFSWIAAYDDSYMMHWLFSKRK